MRLMFDCVSYENSTSLCKLREQQMFLDTKTDKIQSLWSLQRTDRPLCVYIYISLHIWTYTELGMPYTKVQQLRLWLLEFKCIMKLQYLCLKPIMINYKLSLMGNAPLWVFWMHSGWIRMRCWFCLDFCPDVHRTSALALFAFSAKLISVSASVHEQESASASFLLHLLLFHHYTSLACLLLLLDFCSSNALSSHVCCAKPISTGSQASASSIWFVLARGGIHFSSKLIFSHRFVVIILHFVICLNHKCTTRENKVRGKFTYNKAN